MNFKPPDVPSTKELAPPKDTPFTLAELAKYDGSGSDLPIYVAIKGTVFDVSEKKDMYGPTGSYRVFAGKDASKGFGMGSLNLEDAVADYNTLDESQLKVLNEWFEYFRKRYNIVGKVVS